jgi:signal transduction histidine kinase
VASVQLFPFDLSQLRRNFTSLRTSLLKRTRSFLLAIVCIFLFSLGARSQKDVLDSLNLIYENHSLPDSSRFSALQKLTFRLIFRDGELARQKILKGLDEVEQAEGRHRAYYDLYQNLGIYYDVYQKIDTAQHIFKAILEESKNKGWEDLEQRSYNSLGMNSLNSSLYRKAIEYFSKALDLAKAAPNSAPSNYVKYISNLGLANQELKLYDQAIKYHLESLDIREKMGDTNGMSISHSNLGICYRQLEQFDQAAIHFSSAVENAKAAGNLAQYHRLHDNLGSLYLGLNDYPKALAMFTTALDTSDGTTLEPKLRLSIFSNMTSALVDLGELEKGEEYGMLGLRELERYPELRNQGLALYDALSRLYFKKGDFETGNDYLEEFWAITQDVYNAENAQLLTDLQVQYDLEKKENQIALQESKLLEQKAILQRNYFALAAFSLLIIMLIAAFIYARKQHNRQQEFLMRDRELKVKEAYLKATTQSQEQERLRIAQDLHDGFGQFISALRIYISQLKKPKTEDHLIAELANRSDNILDEMSKEISSTVNDLMPTILIKCGLHAALSELAARMNVSGETEIHIEGNTDRYDHLIEINLYRIGQEWVNNVVKYAQAKKIQIRLRKNNQKLEMTIEDDGNVFDTSALESSNRNGWKNIQTRTGLLGGKVAIQSSEIIKGTVFSVTLPLPTTNESQASE